MGIFLGAPKYLLNLGPQYASYATVPCRQQYGKYRTNFVQFVIISHTVVACMKETKDVHESIVGHDLSEKGPFKHG